MTLITIEPAPAGPNGPTKTQGTRVLTADGSEIEGVTRIELVAAVNDVWRARIDCVARLPAKALIADRRVFYPKRRLTLRERLRGWISAR